MRAGQGVTGGTTTQYPSQGPPGVVNDALLAGGDRSAASFAMFRPGVAVSRPNLAKAGDSPRLSCLQCDVGAAGPSETPVDQGLKVRRPSTVGELRR